MQYVVRRHNGGLEASLSETVLLILLSLAAEPRHGYAILKDIGLFTDGRVRMSTGTLYGALLRLLEGGWIERFRQSEAPRGRQAYRLTSRGRRILAAEVERMKNLTQVAAVRPLERTT